MFGYVILPLGFLVLAIVVFRLVLPACAALPLVGKLFPSRCPGANVSVLDPELRAERERQGALQARIGQLEREILALAHCPVVVPEPEPEPEPEPDRSAIDRERWENRDLGLLEGCWQLDSNYQTRDVQTGVITSVADWRVCFDDQGNGTQRLVFSTGEVCEEPMSARFSDAGKLLMRDDGDVQCDRGTRIFEREMACELDQDNHANCISKPVRRQGGGAQVQFRRE